MVYLTSQLNGNALTLSIDGELMEADCIHGYFNGAPKMVDWSTLSPVEYSYNEGRHYYLLQELMPERVSEYYPEHCPVSPAVA